MNCLGRERIAAKENTIIPIPHVENIAVVTVSFLSRVSKS